MTKIWDESGITLRLEEQTPGLVDYLIQFSPWILILFFWFFLMRKMQGSGGQSGIFNFAKSRALARVLAFREAQNSSENLYFC